MGPVPRPFPLRFRWLCLRSGPSLGSVVLAGRRKGGPSGPAVGGTAVQRRQGRIRVALQLSISFAVRRLSSTVRRGSVAQVTSRLVSLLSNVTTWFLS